MDRGLVSDEIDYDDANGSGSLVYLYLMIYSYHLGVVAILGAVGVIYKAVDIVVLSGTMLHRMKKLAAHYL